MAATEGTNRDWLFLARALIVVAMIVAALWVLLEALIPMLVLLLVAALYFFTKSKA